MHDNQTEPLAGDILENVAEIALFLGKSERQTTLLLERREIPGFRLANRWHSRRSSLRRHFDQLEAASQSAA